MRYIMPVTIREEEEHIKPGDQPDDDHTWRRPSLVRNEGLQQSLARAFRVGMDINATSGTESKEWVEPPEFSETLNFFASDMDEAAKKAKRHTDGLDEL